jgi:hypothetical protein
MARDAWAMGGRTTFLIWLLVAAAAHAQPYRPPRTSFGAPDLQGDWSNASFTPLQRPRQFKGLVAAEAEAAAFVSVQRGVLAGIPEPKDPNEPTSKTPPAPSVGQAQSEWFETEGAGLTRIGGRLRTSVIVDPPDGRLPYSDAGRAAADGVEKADGSDFSGPEARMPDERCLMAQDSAANPPMLSAGYNNHYEIVQTPTEMAILVEMIHDVRIIRIAAKHPAGMTHPWMGDSIGRWEGATLVVETVDQNPGSANRFLADGLLHLSPQAKVTERFTRISPTEMRYDFRVDDPVAFARPWRGEMIMRATTAPMYEYACHEGNYALANILAGARAEERRNPKAAP